MVTRYQPIHDKIYDSFLNSQKPSTRATYKSYLKHWIEFSKLTGEQLLEHRRNDKDAYWEQQVMEFSRWLKQEKKLSDNGIKCSVGMLRGFFSYYRMGLNLTTQEKKKISTVRKETSDYLLSNEDMAKLWLTGNLKEKWILSNKCMGLRVSDFVRLTFGFFRSVNLEGEAPIYCGAWNTIKEGVVSHLHVDSDCIPVLKQILESNKDKADTDRILPYEESSLTVILQKLAKKSGIDTHGKTLRFHCLRKYFIDRVSSVMSESKWKQLCGKAISEGAYVSHLELRESYARAMKLLLINSNNGVKSKKILEMESMIQELQKENAMYKNILMELLKDKAGIKIIETPEGPIETLPVSRNKWTDLYQQLVK